MNRLLACRVCLAYDTRLCSIMDGQFRDIYEKLVEASLDTEGMLPTSVCYICFSLMKKMLQFRDRSQKANQILQRMICSGLEPSVSSLDMLVKDQTGICWTLGISDIEMTTSGEFEYKVKKEYVKSEMDIDGMSDRNEDYSDSMPVCRDSTLDSEDDLPLQNISGQCKTDRVNIVESLVILETITGHEGAALPEKRKLEGNEAENELVNIQTHFIKTERDKEPREKKQDIFYFKKVEMTTSNIISENQSRSAFSKNDTVTSSNDIFTCDLCKNEYQCKILLESHMKKSHVMEFTGKDSITSDLNVENECKSTNLPKVQEIQNNDNGKEKDRSENKCDLTIHLKVHTKEKPFNCDLCEKCFSQSGSLSRHLRVHTKEKPFKCDTCKKRFSQSDSLSRHLRVHIKGKPFKCDTCKKSFSHSGDLTIHLRVHTNEKPYKCDICKKCFPTKARLIKHLRVHTKVDERAAHPKTPFKCDICEKYLSKRSHLTRHLKVHTKEKPFKCDKCEKCFSARSNLTRHLKVHNEERPLKCDLCGKCFSLKVNLIKHLKVHTKEKPFKCDICEKCFFQSGHLSRHLRVHTKEKPFKCDITKEKPFKCDICEKCFFQSGHLSRHLRVHTKEKPFKCDICEKGFFQSSDLCRHLKVHTKEKPFKCDICEKCFSARSNLTRHLKVHNEERPLKCDLCGKCFSLKVNLIKHLRVHTKKKPFKCDICKKGYSQSGHLTRHLRVHTKEKPFKCNTCKKSFSQSGALPASFPIIGNPPGFNLKQINRST